MSDIMEIAKTGKQDFAVPDTKWTKELKLVREITAKGCNDEEFKLLCYMARTYGLNPLKKEIWAVKYKGDRFGNERPALIFVGRDGLLNIAHRSGNFGCMETVCTLDDKGNPVSATCSIWTKNYSKPFVNTVYFNEYNTGQNLWATKPKMMIMKVAEATCLRRAFNISGIYTEDEFPNHQQETKTNSKIENGATNLGGGSSCPEIQ